MFALFVSDDNLTGHIHGLYDTEDDALAAMDELTAGAGNWIDAYDFPELNLDGDMLLNDPTFTIMGEGEARAMDLI